MINIKRIALLAAAVALGAVAPAQAASPITRAFLANVEPNTRFLDRSSGLAQNLSVSAPMRAFARNLSIDETRVAAILTAHATTQIAEADGMVSGRSAAIDAQAANGRQPIGQADLDHLATLSGRAFDDLYWERQLDALSQLRADYTTYIAAGDDAALVALAKRELPQVERQLLALSKV